LRFVFFKVTLESGYEPIVVFLMDHIMKKFGLIGKCSAIGSVPLVPFTADHSD
jgi:Fe2+ transport system protein B